jgi:hypothetical protein
MILLHGRRHLLSTSRCHKPLIHCVLRNKVRNIPIPAVRILTVSGDEIKKRAMLSKLNNEIKSTLTGLLNCAGVRGDARYRGWIQTRLMDTERRLSTSRKEQLNERHFTNTDPAPLKFLKADLVT